MSIRGKYWAAGGQINISTATPAADAFVTEHGRLFDLMLFVNGAIIEHMKKSETDKQKADFDYENDRMLEELTITRTVDNYLSYISDLLALIYKSKPEMLKSEEEERLDFILSFDNLDELRNAIAEKK